MLLALLELHLALCSACFNVWNAIERVLTWDIGGSRNVESSDFGSVFVNVIITLTIYAINRFVLGQK